jgi:hypothetical protein
MIYLLFLTVLNLYFAGFKIWKILLQDIYPMICILFSYMYGV